MRLRHLTEAERKKMGRDLNHLEDYVLFYGGEGAQDAIEILTDLTQSDSHDLSVKWDGKVALFYGRDADGEFVMGTKGNWAKNTPLRSPEQAHEYITQGGKGEDWRQVMGKDFLEIFPLLEASVPVNFRGFVTGDVIYSPNMAPKQNTKNGIEFTSNQVTYIADPRSEIGKRIAQTKVGIALHIRFSEWGGGDKAVINEETVKQLNSSDVLAMGQTYSPHKPQLDDSVLDGIKSMAQRYGKLIDDLIAPKPGLSDIPNMLYTYNTHSVREGNDADTEGFFNWVVSSGKVSAGKQAKLAALNEQNPKAFPALFELFNAVQDAKDNIITQLDNAPSDIRAVTSGQSGGEGYVSLRNKVKLVPRKIWRPS